MNKNIIIALFLYTALAAGLLGLSGWMLYLTMKGGHDSAAAMLSAFMTAFALITSKMGSCVRAIVGEPLEETEGKIE